MTIALLVGSIKTNQLKQKDAPATLESSQAFYAASGDAPIAAGFLQTQESADLKSFDQQKLVKTEKKSE